MPHKPLTNLYHQRLGQFGEEIAKRYLQKLGFNFIKSNYHLRNGQIDLIYRDSKQQLIFVEVKTRAEESSEIRLSFKQSQALRRTAWHFLQNYPVPVLAWQFDLIWIHLIWTGPGKATAKIKHLKNIFEQ